MRKPILFIFLATIGALLAPGPAAEPQDKDVGGTLQGRVLFQGEKDPPKGIIVSDAVVYLVGSGPAPTAVPAKDGPPVAILDQRDIAFVPHVLPVAQGSKVEIRNSDAILHNVHTRSAKNPPFNRAQLAKRTFHVVFESPEVIPVGCDVHSQMSAYILVLPTPLFTKAGKDGTYTIAGIPPGKYQLIGWHEKYGPVTTEVEAAAGKTAQADVSFSTASAAAKEAK